MVRPELELYQQIEVLYSNHHGWLQGWLRGKLGSAFDAADLAHDTYLRILWRGNAPCIAVRPRRYYNEMITI